MRKMTAALCAFAMSIAPAMAVENLRVLTFGGASNLPLWVGQDKGLFAREGVEVALAYTTGSVPQIKALYAGEADLISTAFDNIVAYTEGQSDIPLPGPADMFAFVGIAGGMNTLMTRAEINDLAEIKGKTVAVDAFKSGYGIVLYEILKKRAGLVYGKDYQAISVGNTDKRLGAMRDGRAVAAIVGAPQDIDARREGFKAMADAPTELGAYLGSALVARRPWAAAHGAAMAGVARAMKAAQDLIFANKAEAVAVLRAHEKSMSDADASAMYDRLMKPGGLAPHAAIDLAGVKTVLRLREEYGEPPRKMGPPDKYVDTSIYEKAVAGK